MKSAEEWQKLWQALDPTGNESHKFFLTAVTDNAKESAKTYTNAYYAILVLVAVYWFVLTGNFQDFKFFTFSVRDVGIVRWALPVIMSFLYYQGVGAFIYHLICLAIIDAFYSRHVEIIDKLNLQGFADPWSVFLLEAVVLDLQGQNHLEGDVSAGGCLSLVAVFFSLALLYLFPPVIIVFILVNNVVSIGGIPTDFAQFTLFLVSVFLFLRTLLLLVQVFTSPGSALFGKFPVNSSPANRD